MLDKLALILASVLGAHVPVGAVALQATALLLEVLGEIPSDAAGTIREPLLGKLAASQLCLRTQVGGRLQSSEVGTAGRPPAWECRLCILWVAEEVNERLK